MCYLQSDHKKHALGRCKENLYFQPYFSNLKDQSDCTGCLPGGMSSLKLCSMKSCSGTYPVTCEYLQGWTPHKSLGKLEAVLFKSMKLTSAAGGTASPQILALEQVQLLPTAYLVSHVWSTAEMGCAGLKPGGSADPSQAQQAR